MGRPITCALFVAVTAALASAQRTWIVDASGGQGTDFRDLPAAFARISAGDTLLIRKGNYSGFQTSKPARMLGGPQVQVSGTVMISNVPAKTAFVIKSVAFRGSGLLLNGAVTIDTCAGRVVLDDVDVKDPSTFSPRIALAMHRSNAVALNNVRAVPGMYATASTITATNSRFTGRDAQPSFLMPVPGTAGITIVGSTLVLGDCHAQGGNGLVRYMNGGAPVSGVDSTNSSLVILGASWIGTGQTGNAADIPAVIGHSGDLLLDPGVTLVSFGAAPGFAGFTNSYVRRLPSLTATGAAPGGTLRTDLHSTQGQLTILFASLLADPVVVPGVGQLWLDPGSMFVLDVGIQDRSEHRSTNIPIPNNPALRGLPLVLQALSGFPPGLETSSAAHVVLH